MAGMQSFEFIELESVDISRLELAYSSLKVFSSFNLWSKQ